MIIAIVGGMDSRNNLFCNGYTQNVIFFCEFMKKYFSDCKILYINSGDFINKYKCIDVIIQQTPLDKTLADMVKKKYPNCKNIFVKYGHEYYNDLSRLLPDGQNDVLHAPKAYDVDEVWISPHFESTKYYYQALYNAKVKILPYIWNSSNLKMNPFTMNDFKREKDIYIVEPHINMFKTALIPILIVNELYRVAPNSFNKLYIIGNNTYNKNKYFNKELLNKIEVLHGYNNKAYFCPRANFPDIFKNPAVILCHQEKCALNYIYLEALFIKIPLVHNSPYLKDAGYYYTDKNIPEGVLALKKALSDFKPVDNSKVINRYSYDNPKVIEEYKNMFSSLAINSNQTKTLNNRGIDKIEKYKNLRKKSWFMRFSDSWLDNHKYYGSEWNWSGDIQGDIPIKINSKIQSLFCKTIPSFIISIDEERKKEMANKLKDSYYFIDTVKFNLDITQEQKHNLILKDHIKCWKKALEMDLDEVIILEDDVIFMDNWRNILNSFIDKNNPDIVRLDSIPYRVFDNQEKDSVYFYKEVSPWCMGGYYMSKKALKHCVDFLSNNNDYKNCEKAFLSGTEKFSENIYTSTPRLCIQDWYKEQGTRVQTQTHMKQLINAQKVYLEKYGKHYPDFINRN